MDSEKIYGILCENLENKKSHSDKEIGNKFAHGLRTAKIVLKLREIIIPNDSSHDEILTVAAWFHDIKNGTESHCEKGAAKTRELLSECCKEDELNEICKIIKSHDDRSHTCDYSVYVKLHQDADHIDHFGIFDIWSTFIYAVPHDWTFLNACEFFENVRFGDRQKFYDELNFDISKAIYNEKMDYVKSFSERFSCEARGEIWNLEKLRKI